MAFAAAGVGALSDAGAARTAMMLAKETAQAAKAGLQVTEKGIARVETHLDAVLKQEGLPKFFQAGERGMLDRLRQGERSAQDIEFYLHELKESAAFRRSGDLSSAHSNALQWRSVTERDLFHINVIRENPSAFNSSWLK